MTSHTESDIPPLEYQQFTNRMNNYPIGPKKIKIGQYFGEIMGNSRMSCFLTHGVEWHSVEHIPLSRPNSSL